MINNERISVVQNENFISDDLHLIRQEQKSLKKSEISFSESSDIEKLPVIRVNSKVSNKFQGKSLNKSSSLIAKSFQGNLDSMRITKIFESNLKNKLQFTDTNDDRAILKVYLEVFQKIISIDPYGVILEKIREKILEAFEKNSYFNDNTEVKNLKAFKKEIEMLKQKISDQDTIQKSMEKKMKTLSVENIELLNQIKTLEEQKNTFKDFRKYINFVDGTPDIIPVLKQIKHKNTIIESLEKKFKTLQSKEKKLSSVITVLKKAGIKINEIIMNRSIKGMRRKSL